jgi:hypothetical protein
MTKAIYNPALPLSKDNHPSRRSAQREKLADEQAAMRRRWKNKKG